jgi:hypothetical protein
MRKSDKKIDKQLRVVLTEVCEVAIKDFEGFQWLTHLVNYTRFPDSLRVVCVFDTQQNLSSFMDTNSRPKLQAMVKNKLFDIGVNINNMASHISYDTEESCLSIDNGKWPDRLTRHIVPKIH